LAVVPRPFPVAPLVVRHRYLAVVPKPLTLSHQEMNNSVEALPGAGVLRRAQNPVSTLKIPIVTHQEPVK
jgi:hypothetical protein